MFHWLFRILCFIISLGAWAQDISTKELKLIVDNDVFFSAYRDKYYTSGLFGQYRWLSKSDSIHVKKIKGVSLNQRIYTSESITTPFVQNFDRPYAGLISTTLLHAWHSTSRYIKLDTEIGWMGPGSQTGNIQKIWHKILGLPTPRGWRYQIADQPILNFFGTYAKVWYDNGKIDIIPETNIALGTVFSHIRQEMVFRYGRKLNLRSSGMYHAMLGESHRQTDNKSCELFIFYAPGLEYVLYNATIEGTLFDDTSPNTMSPERMVVQHLMGVVATYPKWDFIFHYYFRSPETTLAQMHYYGSVQLNYRF